MRFKFATEITCDQHQESEFVNNFVNGNKLKDRLKKLKLRLVRKIRPFNLKNKQYQEKFAQIFLKIGTSISLTVI